MKVVLPFWMDGALLQAIAGITMAVITKAREALGRLPELADAAVCPVALLDLIAYQRGVVRLAGEDDALYRLRVRHAYANARDAGSVSGFVRIWARLGLGAIVQQERTDDTDWDVILISIDEASFTPYTGLFDELVRTYGRTCRRYALQSANSPGPLGVRPFTFDLERQNFRAEL